jgi:hypothetical protein
MKTKTKIRRLLHRRRYASANKVLIMPRAEYDSPLKERPIRESYSTICLGAGSMVSRRQACL